MNVPQSFQKTLFGQPVLPVSRLNERVKQHLEHTFGLVAVVGEIADLARPRSGHVYFSLSDADASLRAVMWKGPAASLPFTLRDGMKVVLVGRVTLYPPRGQYQVVVEKLLPAGAGDRSRALEAIKRRLEAEGLFSEEAKQPLPFLPFTVGVITSATGAAVHDIIRTSLHRFPRIRIRIFPVSVQGTEAPATIVKALSHANRPGACDVILLGRGGGSLEDLWAFNDEKVVRAVAASQVPLVSCVGHETDVTLSDLAADLRASTPTRAAELSVPRLQDILQRLSVLREKAGRLFEGRLELASARLEALYNRPGLRTPGRMLEDYTQALDDTINRLHAEMNNYSRRLHDKLEGCGSRLSDLNPLSIVKRGYSVTRDRSGRVVRSAASAHPGDALEIILSDGRCDVTVTKVQLESLGGTNG